MLSPGYDLKFVCCSRRHNGSSMAYTYTPLLSGPFSGPSVSRRATFVILQWRSAFFISMGLLLFLLSWLQSDRRHLLATPSAISCQRESWFLFPAKTEETSTSIGYDFSFTASANHTSRNDGDYARIAHLESCTYVDLGSSYLLALLENHRQYCRQAGIEYILRSGGSGPKGSVTTSMSKMYALIDKLEEELDKPEGARIEWIL